MGPQTSQPEPAVSAAPREHDALISLTALHFIQEHELLSREKLVDAKKSLQALFLHASGEETLLRRLINELKAIRNVHHAFGSISGTLGAVRKSVATVEERVGALRARIEATPPSAEANADFFGMFVSFSQAFVQKITGFADDMEQYMAAREQEARAIGIFHVACEVRERLRQRLSGKLAQADGEIESRIKQNLNTTVNYAEAEETMRSTSARAQQIEKDLQTVLKEIRIMCQAAMNPTMRDRLILIKPEDDVFARFTQALAKHPELTRIKDPVRELFKLYQHAHGMFQLDYDMLRQGLQALSNNSTEYFLAKEEDHDLVSKREKLRKIEGLITLLEQSARLSVAKEVEVYQRFSRELSTLISKPKAPWSSIAEGLLRAKVQAEAELNTRL